MEWNSLENSELFVNKDVQTLGRGNSSIKWAVRLA